MAVRPFALESSQNSFPRNGEIVFSLRISTPRSNGHFVYFVFLLFLGDQSELHVSKAHVSMAQWDGMYTISLDAVAQELRNISMLDKVPC